VRESTIRSQVGHIQIYRKGYSERGNLAPFDYLVPDYTGLSAELSKLPHVRTVTARLNFSGLISTGDTTTAFVGTGVQPDGERDLSALAVIVEGKDLAGREPRGITLGLGLARAFGVKPGDDLTLLTTTKGGSINALAVKVRGVWESGEKAYDDRFLRVPLGEVQRLLDLEAGEVQSVVILLDATENTEAVRASIERLIRERGLDLELRTWEDLALRYHQVRELFGRIFAVLTLIVSIMVVFGITNTMTMAIFERTREIGTVMAAHRAAGLARPRARAQGASGPRLRGRIDSPRAGPYGRGPWTRARDTGGRRPLTCASSSRSVPAHRWASCCAATGIRWASSPTREPSPARSACSVRTWSSFAMATGALDSCTRAARIVGPRSTTARSRHVESAAAITAGSSTSRATAWSSRASRTVDGTAISCASPGTQSRSATA
jgi:hypothetical protein